VWLFQQGIRFINHNEQFKVDHRRVHRRPCSNDDLRVTGEDIEVPGVPFRWSSRGVEYNVRGIAERSGQEREVPPVGHDDDHSPVDGLNETRDVVKALCRWAQIRFTHPGGQSQSTA
jgi:hypothetical protein